MRKFAILALGSSGEALSSAMCLVGTRRFSEASRQGELRFVLESLRPTALQLRRSCHRTCLVGGRGTARDDFGGVKEGSGRGGCNPQPTPCALELLYVINAGYGSSLASSLLHLCGCLLRRLCCCRGLCFGRPRRCRLIKRARAWKSLVLPKAPCPKLLLLRCEGLPPY